MKQYGEKDNINLSLFVTPRFCLHTFNELKLEGTFVEMSRESYRESAFLDYRIVRAGNGEFTVKLQDLLNFYESKFRVQQKVFYIFHTAFCCSTLLSRAMDIPGTTITYREPVPLRQLATIKRFDSAGTDFDRRSWGRLLELVVALLSRKSVNTEIPVVKPTDSCNNIIPELLSLHAHSKGVVIYDDLTGFLVSSLKSDSRRKFARKLLARATADARHMSTLSGVDVTGLSDGRAAAFVWAVQMTMCNDAIDDSKRKLCSVRANDFIDSPGATLISLSEYLGMEMSEELVKDIIEGPVFRTHSKSPRGALYDRKSRQIEKQFHLDKIAEEINDSVEWVRSVSGLEPDMLLPNTLRT